MAWFLLLEEIQLSIIIIILLSIWLKSRSMGALGETQTSNHYSTWGVFSQVKQTWACVTFGIY